MKNGKNYEKWSTLCSKFDLKLSKNVQKWLKNGQEMVKK